MYSVKLLHLLVLVLSIGLSLFASKNFLAIFIKSQGSDLEVGCVKRYLSLLAVDFLLNQFLNVDAPAAAVHSLNFARTTFVGSAHNLDSITLAYWNGTHVVFLF